MSDKIIFALDLPTVYEVKEWVKRLENHISFYKVGYELFLKDYTIVEWLKYRGFKVMLDLKLLDIPRTVCAAVGDVKNSVDYITLHSRKKIIDSIVQDYPEAVSKILAVTVLTCFNDDDLKDEGYNISVKELVDIRSKHAIMKGCGLVCSGLENKKLRETYGDGFVIVNPGISDGKPRDDQDRVVTVKDAFLDGANHLVIGRPIIKASDPIKTVENIFKGIP